MQQEQQDMEQAVTGGSTQVRAGSHRSPHPLTGHFVFSRLRMDNSIPECPHDCHQCEIVISTWCRVVTNKDKRRTKSIERARLRHLNNHHKCLYFGFKNGV